MGGEAGGEIASRIAVETIVPSLRAASGAIASSEREWQIAQGLVAGVETASERIKEEAHDV